MPLPISIRCRETAGFGAYSRVRSAMISRRDTPAAPSRGGTKKTTASQAKADDGREIAERLPRSPPPRESRRPPGVWLYRHFFTPGGLVRFNEP